MLEGFDVSSHNAPDLPQWPKVAFGFVRLSHGRGLDTGAAEHLARMRSAGVEIGAYHSLRGDSPGYEQADVFWDRACDLGGGETFALAVDLEHLNPPAPPWDHKVYRYRALDFRRRVRDLSGRRCGFYGPRYIFDWLAFTADEIGDDPLWISDIQGAAQVPAPWEDWTVHQYSYGPGNTLDHNRFRGTRADFRRAFGLEVLTPTDEQVGALAERVRRASGQASAETFVNVDEGPVIG